MKIKQLSWVGFLLAILMCWPLAAQAGTAQGFEAWKSTFKARVQQTGLPADFIDEFVGSLQFKPQSIALDKKQPEKTITLPIYQARTLTQQRIDKGRALRTQHASVLEPIATQYGVDPNIIVALWGKESNFGGYMGNFDIPSVLATMAYEGRRGEFFAQELYKAMKIVWQGHVPREAMIGSWAGAMGQCQFMPSSFMNFAADGDGDGRKNIWQNEADVFASAANYLKQNGWQAGQPVLLPLVQKGSALRGQNGQSKTLQAWLAQGLQIETGYAAQTQAATNQTATLYVPDGQNDLAYLTFKNFDVLKRWNRSNFFATTVAEWAHVIAQ